jgi:hypothetical protein
MGAGGFVQIAVAQRTRTGSPVGIYADTCKVLGIEGAIFERRT